MKRIPLSQGQFALVDDEDFERLNSVRWYACWAPTSGSFYAQRNVWNRETKKAKIVLMHRVIANPPKGFVVDHESHDTLDNRKSNIRTCSRSNNSSNRKGAQKNSFTGIRGVIVDNRRGGFLARLTLNGKQKHLGHFHTKEDAAAAYAAANKKYFGEFNGRL